MEIKTQTYVIEPEVAGSFGVKTERDVSTHPPIIKKLHYVFDGWLGDDIVESFPIYLVSQKLQDLLNKSSLTGFEFDNCELDISDTFKKLQPYVKLPSFYWLKVKGKSDIDDFWLNDELILTLSERAFCLLKQTNINHCEIEILKTEKNSL